MCAWAGECAFGSLCACDAVVTLVGLGLRVVLDDSWLPIPIWAGAMTPRPVSWSIERLRSR
jgi:hypothetical protein